MPRFLATGSVKNAKTKILIVLLGHSYFFFLLHFMLSRLVNTEKLGSPIKYVVNSSRFPAKLKVYSSSINTG